MGSLASAMRVAMAEPERPARMARTTTAPMAEDIDLSPPNLETVEMSDDAARRTLNPNVMSPPNTSSTSLMSQSMDVDPSTVFENAMVPQRRIERGNMPRGDAAAAHERRIEAAYQRHLAAKHALLPANAQDTTLVLGQAVPTTPMEVDDAQDTDPLGQLLGPATDPIGLLLGPAPFEFNAPPPPPAPPSSSSDSAPPPTPPAPTPPGDKGVGRLKELASVQRDLELIIDGIYDANLKGDTASRRTYCKKLVRIMLKVHPDRQNDSLANPIFTRASQVKNGKVLEERLAKKLSKDPNAAVPTFGCEEGPQALKLQKDRLEPMVDLRQDRTGAMRRAGKSRRGQAPY